MVSRVVIPCIMAVLSFYKLLIQENWVPEIFLLI